MQLTHSNKLTAEQAATIRRLYSRGGWSQNKLARSFKVAQATINNIILNKTYKETNE